MIRRIRNLTLGSATLILAILAIRWGDQEYFRNFPASSTYRRLATPRGASRPDWLWALHRPLWRFRIGWSWFCIVATVGMGIAVASDRQARRRRGGAVVLTAFLFEVVTAAHFLTLLLKPPPLMRVSWLELFWSLEWNVPAAILGAWVVIRGRRLDWSGRFIGGLWMMVPVLRIAHDFLFT